VRRASQRSRVLAVLAEGPATAVEIADETGLPSKHCAAILGVLWRARKVRRTGLTHRTAVTGRRGPSAYLYELPATGLRDTGPRTVGRHRWPSRRGTSTPEGCRFCRVLRRRLRGGETAYSVDGLKWSRARPECEAVIEHRH
jgi:hypothetical protein